MFRCDFCNKQLTEGIKPVKVVTEIRDRFYAQYKSIGWEIVAEKNACAECVQSKRAISITPTKKKRIKVRRPQVDDKDDFFFSRRGNSHDRRDRDSSPRRR